MRGHRALSLLAWAFFLPIVANGETLSIDRSLRHEPAYPAKPKYCLLLLGPEGKTRVWLVAAGEAFYADTNGSGDLTEPGKRVYSMGNYRELDFFDPFTTSVWFPVPENLRIYNVGDLFDRATRTWYHLTVHRLGKLKTADFEIVLDIRGQFRQIGKLARFGDKAQDAPVLHFSGPLTLGLFTSQLVRGGSLNSIEAWVGTSVPAGAKGEPTYLVLNDWIPSYISPIADIEFPGRIPGGKPIRTSVRLTERGGLVRFSGRIVVPEKTGPGKAKVTLTIPWRREGAPKPAAVDIPLVEPRAKDAG
jgi:hypothetical protein